MRSAKRPEVRGEAKNNFLSLNSIGPALDAPDLSASVISLSPEHRFIIQQKHGAPNAEGNDFWSASDKSAFTFCIVKVLEFPR